LPIQNLEFLVLGGRLKSATLLAEASDNFKAYGVKGHRHLPEIEQGLEGYSWSMTISN
jgi:N-acetyl-gamma-glutamylphosphate reductase